MQFNENQQQKIINFFDASTLDIGGEDAFFLIEKGLENITEYKIINHITENNDDDIIEAIKEALIDDIRANGDFFNYNDAMEYLAKKDPTHDKSLDIAERWIKNLKNIRPELLASVHWMDKKINLIKYFDFKELVEIIKNNQ